jgi:hypothetical protein
MNRIASVLLLLALALLAAFAITGCAHSTRGGVNDITYDMSLDRPAVEGGVAHAIEIRMDEGDAENGTLWVDGVNFGRVHSGDHAEVTPDAVVLVNNEPRAAQN